MSPIWLTPAGICVAAAKTVPNDQSWHVPIGDVHEPRMSGLLRWRILDDRVFVSYGAGGPMTDTDFETWLAALETMRFTTYLGGTGPGLTMTFNQRRRGFVPLFARKVVVATMTDSALIRTFIVTPAMLGMKISAFAWSDLGRAMAWLQLEPELARRAEKGLLQLRTRVDDEVKARGRSTVD